MCNSITVWEEGNIFFGKARRAKSFEKDEFNPIKIFPNPAVEEVIHIHIEQRGVSQMEKTDLRTEGNINPEEVYELLFV